MPDAAGGRPPTGPASIVLVGMMGAGKTSVGRRLAELRGWEFFDSDRQIEAMTGKTVAEIWRMEGEPAFRRLEAEVLADALASTTPRVIAAAGGTVLDDNNRRLMQLHRPVVWLRSRPETLAARVTSGAHRPLLDEDAAGVLERLAEARQPYYEEVADVVVDVDDLTPEQVVACIQAAVEHGLERQRDGEHGLERQQDVEHGLERQQDVEHGLERQQDGKHGLERQQDGEHGLERQRDGQHG